MQSRSEFAVAIPTFNRCDELQDRIEELLPQLGNRWNLWIFDNGSLDGTDGILARYAENPRVIIKSSGVNLGMCRNFLRCFEEVESEWLWILGDDDPVTPDSLRRVEEAIAEAADCCAIHFTTACSSNLKDAKPGSVAELFLLKDVTSLMHVSSNIYQAPLLKKSLHVLGPASFTYAPNVAIMVNALEKYGHPVKILRERFLEEKLNKMRWSGHDVALGLSLFPEFIQSSSLRRTAAQSIRHATRWMISWALGEAVDREGVRKWKKLVRQVDGNLSAYGSGKLGGTLALWRHSFPEAKRDLLIRTLMLMPLPVILFFAARLKNRTAGIRGELLKENQ